MVDSFNYWGPITPSNTVDLAKVPVGIMVGGSGDVAAVMQNNAVPMVFTGVPAGTWLPIAVRRVNATGTTATGLVAFYRN